MSIFTSIKKHHQQNLPFVAYRKPKQELVSGLFQQNAALYFTQTFAEEGFVFAPFDDPEPAILFPLNEAVFLEETCSTISKFTNVFNQNIKESVGQGKNFHEELVQKGIEAIHKNQFKKVVLSRKEQVELSSFDVVEVFVKLLQNYKNAFVYVWFHPKVGLWLGATPETLVKVNGNRFETMALAGTQPNLGATKVVWKQKELDEQQFVTDYIVENLRNISLELTVSDVETIKAGTLLHLKTMITGCLQSDSLGLKKLISKLHPTPAVCGFPKEKAKNFILKHENYHRSFYTGFLGEINFSTKNNHTSLFVNLRCMEMNSNIATLFIGGGITKDSNPKKEWDETVAKSVVMKRVLN